MQYSDEIVIFFFYLLKIATIFNPFLSFFIGLIRDIKKTMEEPLCSNEPLLAFYPHS